MKSAVKIILTNNKNKVLLQLKDNDPSYSGYWTLFGWHIENNETPEKALIREIKEEINYSLKNFKLIKKTIVKEFGEVY
jgi:8-oxo-dGTP diphosphatase